MMGGSASRHRRIRISRLGLLLRRRSSDDFQSIDASPARNSEDGPSQDSRATSPAEKPRSGHDAMAMKNDIQSRQRRRHFEAIISSAAARRATASVRAAREPRFRQRDIEASVNKRFWPPIRREKGSKAMAEFPAIPLTPGSPRETGWADEEMPQSLLIAEAITAWLPPELKEHAGTTRADIESQQRAWRRPGLHRARKVSSPQIATSRSTRLMPSERA